MSFSTSQLNRFLFFKVPSAYWSGVRVKRILENECTVVVKHRWINQNPFNSMYFAVQAMAAELTSGALVMIKIKNSNQKISMLVAKNKSIFTKKAIGLITFKCIDGTIVDQAITKAIETGEGQTFWLKSIGIDEKGDKVSEFDFEWTIKVKHQA